MSTHVSRWRLLLIRDRKGDGDLHLSFVCWISNLHGNWLCCQCNRLYNFRIVNRPKDALFCRSTQPYQSGHWIPMGLSLHDVNYKRLAPLFLWSFCLLPIYFFIRPWLLLTRCWYSFFSFSTNFYVLFSFCFHLTWLGHFHFYFRWIWTNPMIITYCITRNWYWDMNFRS